MRTALEEAVALYEGDLPPSREDEWCWLSTQISTGAEISQAHFQNGQTRLKNLSGRCVLTGILAVRTVAI
ncbi:hypothetical protein [Leptolyngbya sp. FACHB-261]|uniref:hypothetical protein n=1 Tax=Leptolyngbya sp. FACHB-261 TaxID=2692806 RepID=UPI001683647B|nr:hypothetical protein [Leptolyngbya sp. FACHB-261]MBD2102356.1 hypothetical protein [Leptolyngbya sp. FACHB-261]